MWMGGIVVAVGVCVRVGVMCWWVGEEGVGSREEEGKEDGGEGGRDG